MNRASRRSIPGLPAWAIKDVSNNLCGLIVIVMQKSSTKFSALTFAIAAVAILPAIGGAQTVPSPATGSVIDLTPNKPPTIAATDAVDTVHEGTHFVSRTGRLSRTTDGQQMIFSFDNDGTESTAPKMIVQPNLNLFLMESVLSNRSNPVSFRVSGTVTEYKGLNYILLDSVQTTLKTVAPAATKPIASAPLPRIEPVPPLTTALAPPRVTLPVPSAEATMNRLLAPPPTVGDELPVTAGVSSAHDTSTGKASVAPDAPVLKVIREGTHLTDQIGRLNHSTDGKQAILTFDTDGKTMQDPPMIILPNMKLAAMEGAVLSLARDVHFRVSGTVTEYKGRNYILLNKAVVIADVETTF